MDRPRWYYLDGHTPVPTDLIQGAYALEDNQSRRVGYDELSPEVNVSTVFLALDHSYGSGPPLLFESMIFGGDLDGEQERYATWDEAEQGHAAMVARARAALG